MPHFTLSAPTITGLFTVFGTIVGGTLTALVEILRRRWKREDDREVSAASRRAAQTEERKILYPQLLAKIAELDSVAFRTVLSINTSYRRVESLEFEDLPADALPAAMTLQDNFVKYWPILGEAMHAYEEVRTKVMMIAGEEVLEAVEKAQKRCARKIMFACMGIDVRVKEDDDPYEQLIVVMRSELGGFVMSRGGSNPLAESLVS